MSGKGKSKLTQSSKSTSSKKRRNKRDIISTPPHREFPATTSTFSGLAMMLSVFLGFLGINNTYAASSISISLSGNVSLNLLKSNTEAVFDKSTEATATVTSNHFTGYTLTVSGSNDTGRLASSNDSSKYLSSIPSAINENTFRTDSNYNDMWGFLPDTLYDSSTHTAISNTNYQPSPLTTGTTIDITNSPNDTSGGAEYKLALGAKVSPSMSLDSYSQTFVLAATGNGFDYHIGYTDDLADIPDDQIAAGVSTPTVYISSTEPVKAGYIFRGWCSVKTTNGGATCPGTTYQAGDPITLDGSNGNNYDLHTIWEAVTFDKAYSDAGKSKDSGYYKMQDMTSSICNAVAIGQETTLIDKRTGNKTYKVGKLKDGHCWMLDNLALGGSAIALTPSDTNITANWTLPASASSFPTAPYQNPFVNTAYINILPSDAMSQAGNWKIGAYYNYCAASAGTYCPASATAAQMTSQDVCPKGWRMPSAGNGGEYQTVLDSYGGNYTNIRNALHLPLSGSFDYSGVKDQGTGACWWSKTIANGSSMYHLCTGTSTVSALGYDGRFFGFSVRCLAQLNN